MQNLSIKYIDDSNEFSTGNTIMFLKKAKCLFQVKSIECVDKMEGGIFHGSRSPDIPVSICGINLLHSPGDGEYNEGTLKKPWR